MGAKSLSIVSAGAIPPSYKRVIDTAPYLSKSEEYDLSVCWRDHGDKRAADRIVRAHLRLAIRMASKYFGYGLPIEDLVSEANVGLAKALGNLDTEIGRAHVRTPVTNAPLVLCLLREKNNNK